MVGYENAQLFEVTVVCCVVWIILALLMTFQILLSGFVDPRSGSAHVKSFMVVLSPLLALLALISLPLIPYAFYVYRVITVSGNVDSMILLIGK